MKIKVILVIVICIFVGGFCSLIGAFAPVIPISIFGGVIWNELIQIKEELNNKYKD